VGVHKSQCHRLVPPARCRVLGPALAGVAGEAVGSPPSLAPCAADATAGMAEAFNPRASRLCGARDRTALGLVTAGCCISSRRAFLMCL